MGGSRILSDKQIDEMAQLRERGWSYRRIAMHFTARGTPISSGSIGWQCLRVGADVPLERRRTVDGARTWGRGKPFSADEDRQLIEMERSGKNPTAIGRALGRGANSIRGRLMTLARHDARREEAARA